MSVRQSDPGQVSRVIIPIVLCVVTLAQGVWVWVLNDIKESIRTNSIAIEKIRDIQYKAIADERDWYKAHGNIRYD